MEHKAVLSFFYQFTVTFNKKKEKIVVERIKYIFCSIIQDNCISDL